MNDLKVIAHIRTDFPEKFGIPRQSGIVESLKGRIIFEPEYRDPQAVKGLSGFNYIWLLWKFEGIDEQHWSPVVTPPRLGGKTHMGVFATRSPFRPNHIGMSCVKLLDIEHTGEGSVLVVGGIDLRDNTPIYDIKPYLPYTDCHEDATGGFTEEVVDYRLKVVCAEEFLKIFPEEKRESLIEVLSEDPRPAYHNDNRKYGVGFAGFDVRFVVEDRVLTVIEVVPYNPIHS